MWNLALRVDVPIAIPLLVRRYEENEGVPVDDRPVTEFAGLALELVSVARNDGFVVADNINHDVVARQPDRAQIRRPVAEDDGHLDFPMPALAPLTAVPGNPPPRIRLRPRPAPVARRAASAARSSTRRILPEIVFGSSANSSRRTRLNGARCARRWRKIASAVSRSARWSPASATKAFRHREAQRVGRRDDRRLGHRRMLDQRAFQLERADPVVGGFEHVVGAADIGEIAVGIAHRDIAGAVDRAGQRHARAPSSP